VRDRSGKYCCLVAKDKHQEARSLEPKALQLFEDAVALKFP